MKRTGTFAAAVIGFAFVTPAIAAEMTLVRNSRPVTATEAADGAPLGGMVHDFYATSDADLLTLGTHFDHWVYQHPYGSDNVAPAPELVAYFPAAGADSFIRFPSSTIMLGGGFNGTDSEKAWADLSNDGPQTDFLFGRLTTTEPGSFDGLFALRGQETYIEMPFSFTLPGTSGPFTETIHVSGIEQSQPTYNPPEPSLPETPTFPEEETSTEPQPLQLTPSPAEQLAAWMADMPVRSLEPNSDFLAMRENLFQNLAQREVAIGTPASVPEPSSLALSVLGLAALCRLRASRAASA